MNEQEMADLFSAQIDRLLGGESAADLMVDGDSSFLSLGQQLIEISFQPSPAAQATFQGQLASWFGPGSGFAASYFGGSRMVLLGVGAVLALIGAGLGAVVLISFIWTGAFFDPSDGTEPEMPHSPTPAPVLPALASPELPVLPTRTPSPTRPHGASTAEDVLPAATSSVGDTISLPTATPIPSLATPEVTVTAVSSPTSDGSDDSNDGSDTSDDTAAGGDHDRGHGNDLDGYDEDNPGQSDGVAGGNDQNNGSDISPADLSRGEGGSSGGGGNGQGGGGNGGNNDDDHGGGKGGGNGNNK